MAKSYSIKHVSLYCLLAISAVITVVFTFLKAHATSFTHDESFTYLNYVHEPFMDIISYKHPYTNNHILNTILMKYVEEVFGTSELLLRLPNIFAGVIYVIYSFRLLKNISLWLILPCFLVMLCNTTLIDFFCLARGYGLSFAFMLMSVYHLIAYFKSPLRKHLVWFNAGAFFAVLSNFSLLNYYAAALVAYNMIAFLELKFNGKPTSEKYNFWRLNRIHLIAIVIFVAVLYEPIRRISKQEMLDFGGKTGFVHDTFGSIVKGVLYETGVPEILYVILPFVLVALLSCVTIVIIKQLYKKKFQFFKEQQALVIVFLILLGIIVLSLLQHVFIHNDFYTGRFALFLYPLLILNFSYYMNYLFQKKLRISLIFISYSVAVLLILNCSLNMNLQFYQEWKYDCGTKTVMELLQKEHAKHQDPIKLGVNWLFEPTTNFYRYTNNLTWLTKTDRKGLKSGDDYYYLLQSDTNAYRANGKQILFFKAGINSLFVKNNE